MALANLNINVNATANNAVTVLTDFKTVANASMFSAAQSVDGFQKKAAETSSAVGVHAQNMGKALDTSSASISRSSAISSSSISDIGTSADASYGSLNDLNKALAVTGEKSKEQSNTFTDQAKAMGGAAEGWVKNKLEIAAVAVVLGVAAAAAFAFYETLKTGWHIMKETAGFIKGLFTGESYKSANIDALIAMNKEVVDLQTNLGLSARDANALSDALKRLGSTPEYMKEIKAKVTDTTQGKETQNETDRGELDRLGVTYKNKAGQILNETTVIKNAVAVLDTYTEGFDRNSAAVAMGLGSYAKLTSYIRMTGVETEASKKRLDEYNLGIGPETQEYVTKYQTTMLRFNNETRLMGEGFKRVYADMVMPAYTLWANTFAEGWPSIVNATRHILAAFVSLGYGLKMVFDMGYDTLDGLFKAIGGGAGAVAAATEQAMHGNFGAAKAVLISGWEDTKTKISGIGTQITKDATDNMRAMQLAQGFFNKKPVEVKTTPPPKKKGKTWVAAPAAAEEDDTASLKSDKSAVDAKYLEYSKAFEERAAGIKINANNLQLEKDKESYDWGLMTYQAYLSNKMKLTLQNISFERDAKQTELEDAKQALKDLAPATDKEGKSLPEKDLENRYEALKKIQIAQKALNDVTAKGAMAKQTGDNEYAVTGDAMMMKTAGVKAATVDKNGNANSFEQRILAQNAELKAAQNNEELKTAILAKGKADQLAIQEKYDASMLQSQFSAANQAMSIMTTAAGNSRILQLAALAVQTTIAVAQIQIAASVAEMRAYAELGIIGGYGAATAIQSQAFVNTALVIGAGAVSAIQIAGKKATGGPVSGGSTYLVGEKGPELFTPGASGNITPNNQLSGSGTVAITQNFTITGVAADLMQNMKTIAAQAKEAAKAEILNSMNRGGEFALASGRMR